MMTSIVIALISVFVGLMVGFAFGVIVTARVAAGKISDLRDENERLVMLNGGRP